MSRRNSIEEFKDERLKNILKSYQDQISENMKATKLGASDIWNNGSGIDPEEMADFERIMLTLYDFAEGDFSKFTDKVQGYKLSVKNNILYATAGDCEYFFGSKITSVKVLERAINLLNESDLEYWNLVGDDTGIRPEDL